MKKPIILQDPTSFSVYDLKIKGVSRRIVLIGEVHEILSCDLQENGENVVMMPISDFIKQYHKSIGNEKMLDIFSESFYIGKKQLGWLPTLHYLVYITSHLDDARALSYIRKRLDACSPKYNFSLYECPEHLRVHLCDVRFVKEMEYSVKRDSEIDCLVDKLFKIGLTFINVNKIPKVNYAFSELVSFVKKFLFDKSSPQYHVKLADYIIEETKVQKQVKNIDSRVVRHKLIKWTHQYYDNQITEARKKFIQFERTYGQETKKLAAVEYVSVPCINAFVEKISLPILYVISVFMDSYLTARLLRKFSDSTYAENSIIYVGEFHAKQYRKLFASLGAKEIFHKSSINNYSYRSCVDISKFYYSHVAPHKK